MTTRAKLILSENLPVDPENPLSCVYWLYDTRKHTEPSKEGYVGVCKYGMEKRLADHKRRAENGSKLPVHSAIRKYGEFLGAKVLLLADPEFCLLAEYLLRPLPNIKGTLNIAMGGVISPTTGTNLSAETREKIGKANTGKPGTTHTPEHLARMSERFSGERNPMFGISPSEDVKDKISKAFMESDSKSLDSYKELVKNDANTLRGYAGWRAPNADKEMWLRAEDMYDIYVSKGGCGQKRLSSLMNTEYTPSALATISKKLRTGWSPNGDTVYQEWKTEFLTQKAEGIDNPKTFNVCPWENSSAKSKSQHVWVLADQMYDAVQTKPGIGSHSLGKIFRLSEAAVVHVNKKLRSGWIPREDRDWVDFVSKYKELHESAHTT